MCQSIGQCLYCDGVPNILMNDVKVVGDASFVLTSNHIILETPGSLINTFSKFSDEIIGWCSDSEIEAELIGVWFGNGSYSLWHVPDSKQKAFFVLHWDAFFPTYPVFIPVRTPCSTNRLTSA